jgi:tetratricopeptide (TPR) repeat protein
VESLGDTLKKAMALHNAAKYGEAAALYRDILLKDPANIDALHLLALIAMQFDQPTVVLSLAEQGLKLQPNNAFFNYDKATALRRLGQKEEAMNSIHRALERQPKNTEFLAIKSSILHDMRRYDDAVAVMRDIIAAEPAVAKHYNNLGIILGRMGRNEEALEVINQYIALKPDMPQGFNNRANVYKTLRRYREALVDYEKALDVAPDVFMGRANKGIVHLVLGEYAEGWKLFEDRKLNTMPPEGKRFDSAKRWKGELAASSTIVLYKEQGLGDTVQFCRYIDMVRGRVGKVILEVQPSLIPLLKSTWPDLTYITEDDALPPHDLQCPFMSLPHVFGTTTASIPSAKGYLKADPAKNAAWKSKLPQDGKKRVGLVWAGNPEHMNDHWRSIHLSKLAPLFEAKNVHFFALQKGDVALKQIDASMPITVLDKDLTDFAETAALISNLDLLITVDTAPLHIAGALGVPAYALLQYDPDWRWMAEGETTPWYDSVTLFRQNPFGSWDSVVEKLVAALQRFAA